jgi:hypothetical protein
MEANHGKEHYVERDNFFMNIKLFEELTANGNSMETQKHIKNFQSCTTMYVGLKNTPIPWFYQCNEKEKQAIVLLSTHAVPIEFPCPSITYML